MLRFVPIIVNRLDFQEIYCKRRYDSDIARHILMVVVKLYEKVIRRVFLFFVN